MVKFCNAKEAIILRSSYYLRKYTNSQKSGNINGYRNIFQKRHQVGLKAKFLKEMMMMMMMVVEKMNNKLSV